MYTRSRKDIGAVVDALESVAETRIVWPEGLLNPGGPHRRLRGMISPISIGEDECAVFGRLIAALRPRCTFVIGNAFGFSSAFIAHVMEAHGGERVITLDNQREGNGARCARIARRLRDRLGLRILQEKKGSSPQDVAGAVAGEAVDLVFIDGKHTHPQVTRDFEAALPFAHDRSVFVWHDYWTPGVPPAARAARSQRYHLLYLPTSCGMILGTRSQGVFETLVSTHASAAGRFPDYRAYKWLGIVLGHLTTYTLQWARGRA